MRIEKENYTIMNGDCVLEMRKMADASVGFSVFSPPFADLYTYSDDPNDMSIRSTCSNSNSWRKNFSGY